MRKRVLLSTLVLLLVAAYLIFAPRPLSTELGMERTWVTNVGADETGARGGTTTAAESGADERNRNQRTPVAFRLGDNFSYLDRNTGELLTREGVLYDVVYEQETYVNFSAVSQTAVIRNRDGTIRASIQASGYPYMSGGRLFLLHPEGTALSEWSLSGEQLWERPLPAVITSLAAAGEQAVVGLADGSVRLLGSNGAIVDTYRDPLPRIPIALGVAATRDGSSMAAVSGIDPQQVIIFERAEEQLVPRREVALGTNFRRPVYVGYHLENRVLAVETTEGVLLHELTGGSSEVVVPVEGRLSAIASDERYEVIAAVGARTPEAASTGEATAEEESVGPDQAAVPNTNYSFTLRLYPDRPLASFDYEAEASSLRAEEGWILIGVGNQILGLQLERL